jgi:hypothetical protein
MRAARLFLFCAFLAGASAAALAQANEIAVTVGGDFVKNSNNDIGKTLAIEGSLAHRLIGAPLVGLYAEVPIAAGFSSKPAVKTACAAVFPPPAGCITQPFNYSSLFVTPGLKLKIGGPGVAPYAVVGGGIGHFSPSVPSGSTTTTKPSGTTTGVISYGVGADVTLLPFIGLRGEVRDYNSGYPAFGLGGTGRQHNIFVTVGAVLRF